MSLPSKLHTDRLILRLWEEEDLESFAKMNADPIVMTYFPSVLSRKNSQVIVGWALPTLQCNPSFLKWY